MSRGGLRSDFQRLVRGAAESVREHGWRYRRSQIVRHHDNGYWAQVVLLPTGWAPGGLSADVDDGDEYQLYLTAGVCSPYLLRVMNRRSPTRMPGQNFAAAHGSVVWARPISFRQDGADLPPPPLTTEPPPDPWEPVSLTGRTAPDWLADTFTRLVPAVDALCSDRALRDRLLVSGHGARGPSTFDLRHAALLTRRLGEQGRLEDILQQAAESRRRDDDRAIEAWGYVPGRGDDQRAYPQDWSHDRFVQFLEQAPT